MSEVTELARRYVRAWQEGDDAELTRIALEVGPAQWGPVMDLVTAQLPDVAMPDAPALSHAGARAGIEPELGALVAGALTGDLAALLATLDVDAIAEDFTAAAAQLEPEDVGRVRFRLRQIAGRALDAGRLSTEALEALAAATGRSVEMLRQLAVVQPGPAVSGLAARSAGQQAGEGRAPEVVDERVDPMFGIGE